MEVPRLEPHGLKPPRLTGSISFGTTESSRRRPVGKNFRVAHSPAIMRRSFFEALANQLKLARFFALQRTMRCLYQRGGTSLHRTLRA